VLVWRCVVHRHGVREVVRSTATGSDSRSRCSPTSVSSCGCPRSAIRAILANPRYLGCEVWNKQRNDVVLVAVDPRAAREP
jgi:hypothetical protein